MKEIPLSQGKVALVDDEDYLILSQCKWSAEKQRNMFYAFRNIPATKEQPRGREYMHRFLLNHPKLQTDHIDGNGLNNQRGNLRVVTHRGNQQNLYIRKTSKFPGVHLQENTTDKKWVAGIKLNGKRRHIGMFSTEEEAAIAYRVAERVLCGEP